MWCRLRTCVEAAAGVALVCCLTPLAWHLMPNRTELSAPVGEPAQSEELVESDGLPESAEQTEKAQPNDTDAAPDAQIASGPRNRIDSGVK